MRRGPSIPEGYCRRKTDRKLQLQEKTSWLSLIRKISALKSKASTSETGVELIFSRPSYGALKRDLPKTNVNPAVELESDLFEMGHLS
jgi:hypothetical protein